MQETASEGHPFHSRTKGQRNDIGGPFYSKRQYMTVSDGSRSQACGGNDPFGRPAMLSHHGPLLSVNPGTVGFPPDLSSSVSEHERVGATAVARWKPGNSFANLETALAEIKRDGLPHLPGSQTWESRTLKAKNAGDEFLNVEFGWLPLVSDVKSFAKAVKSANSVLEQYERDAGKVVRRRYNFPEFREKVVIPYGYEDAVGFFLPYHSLAETDNTPRGGATRTRETVRRQWYAGAFSYALPSGYDSRQVMDKLLLKANKVYGLDLTPEVLWEATPWSWAVDWFTNTGDVISNITAWANDGLVQLYGYMMEHTVTTDTYTMPRPGLFNNRYSASDVILVTETKIRTGANPFGFGFTWDGLSPVQKAIAAALGISRRR
jgi:hypothetical protein